MNIFDIMQSYAKDGKIIVIEDTTNNAILSFDFYDEEEEHIAFFLFANSDFPIHGISIQRSKVTIKTTINAKVVRTYTLATIESIFSKAV